ncbi:MAG: hypothetical protein HY402_03395 [Elusimicrobia bacterium]|nr:hypothetical protein [Elusimicrobiota bacterium]
METGQGVDPRVLDPRVLDPRPHHLDLQSPMNKSRSWVVCGLFLFLAVLYLPGVWKGLPGRERADLVFSGPGEIARYQGGMLQARQRYYEKLHRAIRGEEPEEKLQERGHFQHLQSRPFQELPADVVLDAARGYLIGMRNSDEQRVLSALSRIRPREGQLDPQDPIYGGFYYYLSGLILGASGLLGLFQLSPEVGFYLLHPDQAGRMYLVLRTGSAFFSLLAFVLLFQFLRKHFGPAASTLACLWLAINPWTLSIGQIIKPHAFSIFCVALGVWYLGKIDAQPWGRRGAAPRGAVLGAIFGSAAAALYPNGVFFLLPLIYFWRKSREGATRTGGFGRAALVYLATYGGCFWICNFYLLWSWPELMGRARENRFLFSYGAWSLSMAPEFLWSYFSAGWLFLTAPLLGLGGWRALRSEGELFRLSAGYGFFVLLISLFYLRHPSACTIGLTLWVPQIALGFQESRSIKSKILRRGLPAALLLWMLLSAAGALCMLSRQTQQPPLYRAGRWINEKAPPGTSIGVPNGWFLPAYYPPFRFLDYRLVHVPLEKKNRSKDFGLWPEYLVTYSGVPLEDIPPFYNKIQDWREDSSACSQFCRFFKLPVGEIVSIYRKAHP